MREVIGSTDLALSLENIIFLLSSMQLQAFPHNEKWQDQHQKTRVT